MKTAVRLTATSVTGLAAYGLILFGPAGTLDYRHAWVFLAVFAANPAALRRRMRARPRAETRTGQKFIVTASFLELFAPMAFSAVNHRMGWSAAVVRVCRLGDVPVEPGRTPDADGRYAFVRHPMDVADAVMTAGGRVP